MKNSAYERSQCFDTPARRVRPGGAFVRSPMRKRRALKIVNGVARWGPLVLGNAEVSAILLSLLGRSRGATCDPKGVT
jgi:hypothetical protein